MAVKFLKRMLPHRKIQKWFALLAAVCSLTSLSLFAAETVHKVLLRDVTQIEGVRDNQLVGYGLVAGLNRTGDTQQTYFTVQTLANALTRMGVQIAPGTVVVKNVAAVFVTANLPPFARPGMKLDVTVSSVGDAKSIVGGVLLLTALRAANGQVYAEAEGPLVIGGYSEGAAGNVRAVNHPTVGRIANGGIIEREAAVDLSRFHIISLLLFNSDFTAARDVADVINKEFGKTIATALDSNRIDVNVADSGEPSVPILISRVQNLSINARSPAKVVVNERTGTIVMGKQVHVSPVAIMHGNLSVEVQTQLLVSQPNGFSQGTTQVVPQEKVAAQQEKSRNVVLPEGATVEDLVRGLNAIGSTPRDIIAILQSLRAAGALEAEIEVI